MNGTEAIELSIDIAAIPEVVFKYFSDAKQFRAWMGEASSIDPRSGGAISVAYGPGPTARGQILEWIANQKIVFSWGHGEVPNPAATSQVTITLTPSPSGTLLRLCHSGLTSDIERAGTASGWRYYLAQLSLVSWQDKLHGTLERIVDTYIRAWNENDFNTRAALLAECWAPDGSMQDKFTSLKGRDTLNAHIAAVKPMMPGMSLERAGAIEQCHGFAWFPWKIMTPAGEAFARGVDFCELDSTGKVARLVGFWNQ